MSAVQKFFQTILPKRLAEEMEDESRTSMVRCPCGYERSIWDMGGIRWKAAGNPKRYLRCPQCGQAGWHTVYRKQAEE